METDILDVSEQIIVDFGWVRILTLVSRNIPLEIIRTIFICCALAVGPAAGQDALTVKEDFATGKKDIGIWMGAKRSLHGYQ